MILFLGLVTLSSDPEEDVRISSICGLGTVMTCANDVLKEKACFQFMSFFDDSNSHFVFLEVVRVVGQIWIDLPTKIREEIILPKVAKVHAKYGNE